MKKVIIICILILLGVSRLFSQINVPAGDIFGNWKQTDSPFIIDGDVYLPADKKLTIESGVTIIFSGPFSFEIAGRIEVLGNENQPVTFTMDDTAGFSAGNYIGWNGIIFEEINSNLTENSVLNYAIVEFAGNSAITCINYEHLIILNSTFKHNIGSGISLYQGSNIEIENITLTNNRYTGFVCNNSSPVVNGFEIKQNTNSGIICSGIGSSGNPAIFTNGKVLYNVSELNSGGVDLVDGSGVIFENVEIAYNEGINGGGVYCHMSTAEFLFSNIHDNIAEMGGGLYSSYYVDLTINHSVIAGNIASFDGGGIFAMESNFEIIHATISNNFAYGQGGGVCFFSFDAAINTIRNSILWNNTPEEIFSIIESPSVSYSNIMGGYEGEENIDSDPMFVNPFLNDYQLQWGNFPEENEFKSPCIDTGDPGSAYDPDGTIADIGAFYFNQDNYITEVVEIEQETQVKIYPNPAKNELNVSHVNDYSVLSIFSLTGEKVFERNIGETIAVIDVASLQQGLYTLVLQRTDGQFVCEKFIKQ